MSYEQIDPSLVWDKLGNDDIVVGVVLDDSGKFKTGVYSLNDTRVYVVIELINQDNTVFFIRKGE